MSKELFGKNQSTLQGFQKRFIRDEILPIYQEMLHSIPDYLTSGFPTFNEELPGMTGLQQMSLAGIEGLASGDTATGNLQETDVGRQALIDQLQGGRGEVFDEFYNTNVRDPLLEIFTEDVAPTIKATAVGGGELFGGETNERLARADEELLTQLVRGRSGLALEREKMRTDALRLLPEVAGLDERLQYDTLASLFGAGEAERQIGVQRRQARLEEFLRQIAERNSRLGMTTDFGLYPIRSMPGSTAGNEIISGTADVIADAIAAAIGAP